MNIKDGYDNFLGNVENNLTQWRSIKSQNDGDRKRRYKNSSELPIYNYLPLKHGRECLDMFWI